MAPCFERKGIDEKRPQNGGTQEARSEKSQEDASNSANVNPTLYRTFYPHNMARTNYNDLLDAGVHFGHLKRKWNPNMAPYIFMERKWHPHHRFEQDNRQD
jgi:hypothetical protein